MVARAPDGALIARKLLSENTRPIATPPCRASAICLGLDAGAPIPSGNIGAVKMGTTVATNALLERKGERTAACHHARVFATRCKIGYQARPKIFAKQIIKPEMLLRARSRNRRARSRRRHGRSRPPISRRARANSKA